jgi:hypothetical protein
MKRLASFLRLPALPSRVENLKTAVFFLKDNLLVLTSTSFFLKYKIF